MNELPSISIIVPVYKVENYIIDCLKSVSSQQYDGHVECILVDDCGEDDSMALAKEYIESYKGSVSFVIYAHSHNRGLSAARNTGMQHATGDYLFFLDSDDELLPEAFSILTRPILQEEFDVVAGLMRTVGSDYDFNCAHPSSLTLRNKDILHEYALNHIAPMACNKLFRRQMVIQNQLSFYEGIIHEDELWSFQIAVIAHSFHLVEEETYLYKIREGSITTANSIEKRRASLHIIFCESQKLCKKHELLNDQVVQTKIESFRLVILKDLCKNWVAFKNEYCNLRAVAVPTWKSDFKLVCLHPIRFIRNFHYALPSSCGAVYHYIWIRLTSVLYKHKLNHLNPLQTVH